MNITLLIDWNSDGDWLDANEDVSSDLMPALISERGKDQIRVISPPMAGRLNAQLDNRTRKYSAENSSSALYGSLEPGKKVRLKAGTYTVWTGVLENLSQTVRFGNRFIKIPSLGTLSQLRDRKISTPVYQNIRVDQAIGYILDAVGWSGTERVLSVADTTLQLWWLDEEDAFSAMLELLTSEGAGAAIYEDELGRIVFENRNYRTAQTRSTVSQHTFTDVTDVLDFDYSPDFNDVINFCEAEIAERQVQAEQAIWEFNEQVIFTANQVRTFVIRANDPFINAVIPSAAPSNASQLLTPSIALTSGIFKLQFRGVLTAGTVSWDASAATIQTALEGLSSIGAGNVICTGGPINTTPVFVTFLGTLGGQEITDLIEVVQSTLNPVSVTGMIEVAEMREGGGFFIEIQALAPSGVLTAGTFTISVSYSGGTGTTSSLNFNATAAQIQTALRAISGFGATLAFGGPISTSSVQLNFANVTEAMALAVINPTGLTTTASGATIDVTQGAQGGVADYAVMAGGIASKVLDRDSGTSCRLTITATSAGATLSKLRVRGQPFIVQRSEMIKSTVDTSASQAKYGFKPSSPSIRKEIDRDTMQTVVNGFADFYKRPRPTVIIKSSNALVADAQLFERQISDRLTVVEQQTGVNREFWLEHIGHTFKRGNNIEVQYGLEAAHTDAHSDTHSDAAHSDSHTDTHSDVAHSDTVHTDTHSDVAHGDAGHTDTHSDTHTDTHTDDIHTDTHTDSHTDTAHTDSHTDSHTDTAHGDSHVDAAHGDEAHTDTHGDEGLPSPHTDSHGDIAHGDDAHTDTHSDAAHGDVAHGDVAHGDVAHGDVAHGDVAHGDVAHGDTHSDVAHVDTHSDSAHTDAAHTDTHSDVAHSDTHTDTHSDVAHSDVGHGDSHTDSHTDAP